MPTPQERLNYAIAAARANGTVVSDKSLAALGSKCVTCPECDGTGLPVDSDARNIHVCKGCSGRGYVSVAQPKPIKYAGAFDFRKDKSA